VRLAKKLLYDDPTRRTELLGTPVCDLDVRVSGTLLGDCTRRAGDEARAFGVTLEPYFYLSDAYGCVQGTANVGLGFWDTDETLRSIYRDKRGLYRDELDLVLLLKHEIGHAFCYAHKLYQLTEFRKIFGLRGHFFSGYPDHNRYAYDRFSLDHVNPDGDHYAQKHPDDDFAETFCTYLDATGAWRERYRGRIGALRKIAFVGDLVRTYGPLPPVVEPGTGLIDAPVEAIRKTVAQFFRMSRTRYLKAAQGYIDDDLRAMFHAPGRLQRPASPALKLLGRYRKFIENSVRDRVRPKDPRVVSDLLDKIRSRLKALPLVYPDDEQARCLAELHGLVLHKTLLFHRFGVFRED
jgi:hypothetical protein